MEKTKTEKEVASKGKFANYMLFYEFRPDVLRSVQVRDGLNSKLPWDDIASRRGK